MSSKQHVPISVPFIVYAFPMNFLFTSYSFPIHFLFNMDAFLVMFVLKFLFISDSIKCIFPFSPIHVLFLYVPFLVTSH